MGTANRIVLKNFKRLKMSECQQFIYSSTMQRLLLVLIPAVWVVAIAILSVQNATPVAIKFLTFQSVELPFGVILSFCVAGGMVATALLIFLLGGRKRLQR